ncbi:GspE/PulE family protein [Anaerobacterium chartisolvens]|nr:ATPase, T2SS/T4P/T4SS family [Anaerobacterium chartisolvens]
MKNTRNYLGSKLVENGIITERQLEEALVLQEENSKKDGKGLLGQALVQMGYCTEDDIARIMARKTGATFVSLRESPIDMTAANLITPEIANRYNAMPIGFEKNKLLVAMLNPSDIIAVDDLRLITGYDIQPAIVADSELRAAINQFVTSGSIIESEEAAAEEEDADQDMADAASEKPAVQLANQIFNQSVKAGASDVHIEPHEKKLMVRFRIDGVLHEIMQQPSRLHASLVSRIKVMASMDIAERRIPQDGRITMKIDGKTIDVRVASLPTAYGEKLTLRLLNRSDRLITLSELGFPDMQLKKYNDIMRLPYGFVLITGPTGSGKSTTLYATLAKLNSPDKNIITLEDPIERRMDGINQVQASSRAGMTFASGLRSILRNDPDIIMVGEIRDRETARIAVESALTGHFVLSTLHTNNSSGAVTRLADMGVEPYLTASSLVGIIAQRLVRVLCKECKTSYDISRGELIANAPDFPSEHGQESVTLFRPNGCIHCNNTGYRGRKAIYELLVVTEEIQKMILNRSSARDIELKAIDEGMVTLRQDAYKKVKQGITSMEEIVRVIV